MPCSRTRNRGYSLTSATARPADRSSAAERLDEGRQSVVRVGSADRVLSRLPADRQCRDACLDEPPRHEFRMRDAHAEAQRSHRPGGKAP